MVQRIVNDQKELLGVFIPQNMWLDMKAKLSDYQLPLNNNFTKIGFEIDTLSWFQLTELYNSLIGDIIAAYAHLMLSEENISKLNFFENQFTYYNKMKSEATPLDQTDYYKVKILSLIAELNALK